MTFRVLFGALMLVGALRFMYYGWVERLYVEPTFFFKFYGFEWVEVLTESGMYLLLWTIVLSSGMVMLGLFYRLGIVVFFLSFTYLELIDATNYLNHYYLVILLAFLMIFLPANRKYSLDVWRKPELQKDLVPRWMIGVLVTQLTLVYTFAGIAKLNPDWLYRAMPLTIWLPEHQSMPIIGPLLAYRETAFVFSWFGAFYDLTIAYFLLFRVTRPWAYIAVIVFHVMTKLLFNIGLFPAIMITSTLIFFSGDFHEKWWAGMLSMIRSVTKGAMPFMQEGQGSLKRKAVSLSSWKQKSISTILLIFFAVQLLLPFRYLFYPGNLLWTEEAYRFSWRVMLLEKTGQATFRLEDPETGRKTEIINGRYLTQFQEKQMSIQPDFILQFAHFLKREYKERHGINNAIVTVDCHVALNGRTSQRLIDPNVNLAEIKDGFRPKTWILPFKE